MQRDTSRDSHGCAVLMGTIGAFTLGPVGAAGLAYLGSRMDKFVNENRDRYDPIPESPVDTERRLRHPDGPNAFH